MKLSRVLSFRAKKTVCLRTIFTVDELAFFVKYRLFFHLAAYAVLTSMFCGTVVGQDMPLTSSAKTLSDITSAIESRKVGSIEILHMPDGIETRASVTPESLERLVESRVEIMKVNEWGGREELLRTLKATKLASASRMADMRSAIVFNGLNGKRIATLYVGSHFGRYFGQFGGADGSIGNIPIKFEGDLAAWLKEMIPSPLR